MRFDEDNGSRNSPSRDSSPLKATKNNNEFTIENGYMIIPGGSSEEQLRERLRRNKEEWERSNMIDIDFEEKLSNGEGASEKKQEITGGSRNVRKRSSFKDKNAKYKSRTKELNRGSIGHILDKLHLRKGLGQSGSMYASLPYRSGERGSRPDLIQSVLDADKTAGKEFTRRPSLEFFQDLSSQLNSGKKRQSTKAQKTDVPVTIFHNGTLRASRDNLQSLEVEDERVKSVSEPESGSATPKTPEEYAKEPLKIPISDIPVSRIDDEITNRVIMNGAEIKSRKSVENMNEKSDSRTFARPKTHEPHPQRKIKIPKGFIGILPKRPQRQSMDKEENKTVGKTRNSVTRKTKGETVDRNVHVVNKELPEDVNKEHYLIRTLPLPSHGSHGNTRSDKVNTFPNHFTSDYKQVRYCYELYVSCHTDRNLLQR